MSQEGGGQPPPGRSSLFASVAGSSQESAAASSSRVDTSVREEKYSTAGNDGRRYSTFPSASPVVQETEEERRIRAAEHARDRREQLERKQREFRRKERTTVHVVSYNDDDSGSDGGVRIDAPICLSSGSEGEYVYANEIQTEKKNVTAKVSRLSKGDTKGVSEWRMKGYRNSFEAKPSQPFNSDPARGTKQELSSMSTSDRKGSSNGAYRSDSEDRKPPRKRKHKKKKTKKSKKSKRRRRDSSSDPDRKRRRRDSSSSSSSSSTSSSSSSSSSEDERRKRRHVVDKAPPQKHKYRLMRVDEMDPTSAEGIMKLIQVWRQPDPTIPSYDQVFKTERCDANIRIFHITGRPDMTTVERKMLDKIARDIYGEKNFRKTAAKRFDDRALRFSKNPENFFSKRKDFEDPNLGGIVQLSKGRLDPLKPGYEVQEEEHMQKESPEAWLEKQLLETEHRSADTLLASIDLDKFGLVTESIKKINEVMSAQRSKKGQAEQGSSRNAAGDMESMWYHKLLFEDVKRKRDLLVAHDDDEATITDQQFNVLKIDKLTTAFKETGAFRFFAEIVQLSRDVSTSEDMRKLFTDNEGRFCDEPRFWTTWVETLLYDMKFYDADELNKVMRRAINRVDAIIGGKFHVQRSYSSPEQKEALVVRLLHHNMSHAISVGKLNYAVAYIQAMVTQLDMPGELWRLALTPGADRSKIAINLSAYWKSGVPRAGDANSITWSAWDGNAVTVERELAEERRAVDEAEKLAARKYLRLADPKEAQAKLWADLERIRGERFWRPIRVREAVERPEEEDRFMPMRNLDLPELSPMRVALFTSDIIGLLGARIPFEAGTLRQVAAELGMFTATSGIPAAMDDFLLNLLDDLRNSRQVTMKLRYSAIRILSYLDIMERRSQVKPAERWLKAMGVATEMYPKYDTAWLQIATLGLAELGERFLEQRKRAREARAKEAKSEDPEIREKERQEWRLKEAREMCAFLPYCQVIWSRIPGDVKLVNEDDPIYFTIKCTLILLQIRAINHPNFTNWIIYRAISSGKLGMPQTGKCRPFVDDICQRNPVAGTEIVRLQHYWRELREKVDAWKFNGGLYEIGLYQPATLVHIIGQWFNYAGTSRADLEKMKGFYDETVKLDKDYLKHSEPDRAFTFINTAEILIDHNSHYRCCYQKYRELIDVALEKCPRSVPLRRLHCDVIAAMPMVRSNPYIQKYKLEHEEACELGNVHRSALLAMSRIYLCRRIHLRTLAGLDMGIMAGGIIRAVEKEHREVANIQNDPYIWKLLLELYIDLRDLGKAYETYTMAVKNCVWSRELHLLWARYATPEQIDEIQRLMVDKNIPMLAEPDMAQTYLEAAEGDAEA